MTSSGLSSASAISPGFPSSTHPRFFFFSFPPIPHPFSPRSSIPRPFLPTLSTFRLSSPPPVSAQSAEVRVAVAGKTAMGMRKVLGSIKPLRVCDLLETDPDRTLEPEWYEIVAKEGKKSSVGKVLLHVVAARAPPQQPIKLFIGSWNVGNAPPPDDLSPWLPKGTDHELIAIGSQECEYQPRSGYATCMEDWVAAIKAHFAPHYKVVKGTTRGQMRLVVLVLETSQKAITDVTATSEATGIGHVIANKGAVSVSLKFWDTSFCFVNSHLAAHEGHCMTRNDNYREVMRNMHPALSSIDLLAQFHSTIFHQTYLSLSPLPNLSIPFTEVMCNMHPGLSSIDLLSQFHHVFPS
ncbi:unnamed protein product [Closterium sp. Naga37s-1]|nr:unnamed protein product [Closterium sp. Naga37s-1]